MEKRLILAIALSIAVLIGYQYMFAPPPPKVEAPGETASAPPGAGTQKVPAAGAPAAAAPEGPASAPRAINPLREIRVRTPLYTATVSTAGGGIRSFLLFDYRQTPGPGGKPLEIVGSSSSPFPFDLALGEADPAFPREMVFGTDAAGEIAVGKGEKKTLALSWESASGVRITREYVFSGDRYDFEVGGRVVNGSRGTVKLRPGLFLSQDFKGELGSDSYTFHGAVAATGRQVEQLAFKDIDKGKAARLPIRWAAADSKYFAIVFLPAKEWTLDNAARDGETGLRMTLFDAPASLAPEEAVRFGGRGFAGPKVVDVLKADGKGLEQLVDYGWFSFLAKPLVWMMQASNRVTKNYGIDIILLTILIKILFFPLTKKSMASMKKMQELTPVLQKIKEKHKGDTQRINQETMNLYKTYKVNPFGGCLPMVLQIPVFFALYKALLVTIELRHAPFFFWINDLSAPEYLYDIHVAGFTLPLRLLPLLMGISMFVQQKMTPSAGMEPAQAKVMLLLPVIFTFMFWGFPTGLVIYWLVNNVLSIGQQMIHNRQHAAEMAARA